LIVGHAWNQVMVVARSRGVVRESIERQVVQVPLSEAHVRDGQRAVHVVVPAVVSVLVLVLSAVRAFHGVRTFQSRAERGQQRGRPDTCLFEEFSSLHRLPPISWPLVDGAQASKSAAPRRGRF